MEENDNKKDEFVNNTFLNENLKILEDKVQEFEINLGTLQENSEDNKKNEEIVNDEPVEEPIKKSVDGHPIVPWTTHRPFDISIIFLLLSIISLTGLFFQDDIRTVGLILSVISLFGSTFTFRKKYRFGESAFSIAIILVIVYIVIYVVTLTRIDDSVDKEKAKLFQEYAKEITERIKEDVVNSNVIKCNSRGVVELKMVITSLEDQISPFGYKYNKDNSYVLVSAEELDNKCVINYSIYLTDDIYSLGTVVEPVLEDRILRTDVRRVVREQN